MGRPINRSNFGPEENKIAIKFHNGSSVVTGHIIKQMGSRTFLCSDGTVEKVCTLAKTSDEAAALTGNICTIEVETTGGTEYVTRIASNKLTTTAGNQVDWKVDATGPGQGSIGKVPAPLLAVLDFKNGVYTVGGASRTHAQVLSQHADAGAYDPAVNLSAGVGLVSAGAAIAPKLSDELFALLMAGATLVLDMEFPSNGVIDLDIFNNPAWTVYGWFNYTYATDPSAAPASYGAKLGNVSPGWEIVQCHDAVARVAVTVNQAGNWAIAVNGSAPLVHAIGSLDGVNFANFYNTGQSILRSVTVYPMQDSAALTALSSQ